MALTEVDPVASIQAVSKPRSNIRFSSHAPVVIVGNGPVGIRTVAEILNRDKSIPVVIYGEETHPPYDRVKLSSWLIGDVGLSDLASRYRRPFGSSLDERYGQRVVSIDREKKCITDAGGDSQSYSKLVLATGSHAFIPSIEGSSGDGVFSLRNIDDATRLFARRSRSRHTVVIGGGLLGLEAARGMQPNNTQVTVIDHSDRLMANQLDSRSAEILKQSLESRGLKVLVGAGIQRILANPRVSGVQLRSGEVIDCDTVILATGIRPNIELAKQSGLAFGRGITVDDNLLTSDPSIYAVGECAEHRGQVYGLVAPGFEHASTVANHLSGNPGEYQGSIVASRLKVIGTPVFSVGPVGYTANPLTGDSITYHDEKTGIYRKLLIQRHRLIGAVALGKWDQSLRVQSAIGVSARIYPWQKLRFLRSGDLWTAESASEVASWPDTTIVCQCNNIAKRSITTAISNGSNTVEAIGRACGAGIVCGSCKPQIGELLGRQDAQILPGARVLLGLSVAALLMTVAVLLLPPVKYALSVQPMQQFGLTLNWHWDSLWRNGLFKQISGFTILAAVTLATFVSIRKRARRFHSLGNFDGWRVAHLALSVVALIALLLHTGFRLGHGLNFALMSLFVSIIALGIATTLVMLVATRASSSASGSLRRLSLRLHIYLFWPLPLLLGWHILKGYWY